jgi:hypothetical protein
MTNKTIKITMSTGRSIDRFIVVSPTKLSICTSFRCCVLAAGYVCQDGLIEPPTPSASMVASMTAFIAKTLVRLERATSEVAADADDRVEELRSTICGRLDALPNQP